jgi:double-stranded RNA-binding protein Staufen
MTSTGTGPNKKIAKKIAAENLLINMGVMKAPAVSVESPPKERQRSDSERNKKVSFNDPENKKSKSTNPRQIVPGILLVSSSETFATPTKPTTTAAATKEIEQPPQQPAAEKSSSPQSINSSNNDSGITESGVSPRDQLNYLAQLMGFTVSYSDFPKGNHTEFLSLVTLSTEPPHMSHGAGSSRDESRDQAAMKALTALSELGLDNVKPKSK